MCAPVGRSAWRILVFADALQNLGVRHQRLIRPEHNRSAERLRVFQFLTLVVSVALLAWNSQCQCQQKGPMLRKAGAKAKRSLEIIPNRDGNRNK